MDAQLLCHKLFQNQAIEIVLTVINAHNPEALKSYIAELRGKIIKEELRFLHVINDFRSEQVTKDS